MKVQRLQSISVMQSKANRNPAFGNYVIDRQVQRAIEKNLDNKWLSRMLTLGKNNGENLNNIITAAGTAFVAPIFIRYNFLSKEEPETKAYQSWRQPLSAFLALGVQLPAMTTYNYLLDKWAASGDVHRFDLSVRPPKDLLTSYAKKEFNHQVRVAKEIYGKENIEKLLNKTLDLQAFKPIYESKPYNQLVHALLNGQTKDDVIEDILNQKRNDLFYARRDALRAKVKADPNAPITFAKYVDADGKVDHYHGYTLQEITDNHKIQFVKPAELDKARKDSYLDTLKKFFGEEAAKDSKFYELKYDWTAENPQELFEKMKRGEVEIPESLKDYSAKKDVIKKELKKFNSSYDDFARELDKIAESTAIEKVEKEIAEETRAKKLVSDAIDKMKQTFVAKENEIMESTLPKAEKQRLIKETEERIIQDQVLEWRKAAETADDAGVKAFNRAADKITNKGIFELRHHGFTEKEVETSVRIKKWLRAEINRREGVYKNFKKMSGLVFGLALLPITCGLLNWAYPRFMDTFFPKLSKAKKQAQAAKEGK